MKPIYWALRLFLVILLAGFFIKNADPITVRFYLGYQWDAPLALIMLLFFVAGVIIGLLVLIGTIFRLRRELAGFRRARRRGSQSELTAASGAADMTGGP
jgi:lipopolysaccharide assembly protein A